MIVIWFESHGTTPDNEAQVASGWNDVDLSETGRKRALQLAERAKDRKLDVIFSSDLQRAVKTAIPAANRLHLPIYPDMRLRECDYGDFEHKASKLIEKERLNRIDKPFPNGESYNQCMERMGTFFDWLRKEFDGKTVMIIGHRATHYGVEHFALGRKLEDIIKEEWQWQPGWRYTLQ